MSLNESAAKLDHTLDVACKKYEKICFDNGAQELMFKDDNDVSSKLHLFTSDSPISLCRELQRVHQKLRVELQKVQHQASPCRVVHCFH